MEDSIMKNVRHLIAFALLAMIVASTSHAQTPPAALTLPGPDRLIIAHRGASGYLPEHTLQAKALAIGLGADYVEQDVVLSSDNVPVIMHDIYLDATTDVKKKFPSRSRADGRYYAIDFSLAEIRTLAVTERVNPANGKPVYPGRFPQGSSSFGIQTLMEEIEMIQGLGKSRGKLAGIYTEIKGSAFHLKEGRDIDRIVIDTLAAYGYDSPEDRIFVQSFEPDCLKRIHFEFKSRLPLVQLITTTPDYASMLTESGMDEVARYAAGIGPSTSLIVDRKGDLVRDNWLVKAAHARGLLVHPYTFRADSLPPYAKNAEDDMEFYLFTIGVDGLFTDFPDLGVKVLKKHGLR